MHLRKIIVAAASVLLLSLAGCTVQPLYGNADQAQSETSSVAINPVSTRVAQQVRNRLIFLLNGGKTQPASPSYNANLAVSSSSASNLRVGNPSGDSDTTASRVTVTGTLTLTSSADDEIVKTYKRTATASYDRSSQQFANQRAQIDAENRAAAELASIFRSIILSFTKSR